MLSRQAGNNWLPMTGLSLLFLSGGAADLSTGANGTLISLHYVFGSMLLAVVTWLWFTRRKPALLGSYQAYRYLAGAVGFGILLAGAVEPFRGLGPWLVLSAGLFAYGILEHARILTSTGAASAVLGLLALLSGWPVLAGLLQGLCAGFCALAALRLHIMRHGRRKPRSPVGLSGLLK